MTKINRKWRETKPWIHQLAGYEHTGAELEIHPAWGHPSGCRMGQFSKVGWMDGCHPDGSSGTIFQKSRIFQIYLNFFEFLKFFKIFQIFFEFFEFFLIFFNFLSEKLATSVVNWFKKISKRLILAWPGWPIWMADGSISILRMDGWMDECHPSIHPSGWIRFLTLVWVELSFG